MLYSTNIDSIEPIPVPAASIKHTTPVAKQLATPDESGSDHEEEITAAVTEAIAAPVVDAKKAARAAKAKASRLAKKNSVPVVVEPVPVPVVEPVKVAKKRKTTKPVQLPVVDDTVPPAWFKSYLANTRVEEARIAEPKKAQRTVRKEAAQEAEVKWRQPETQQLVSQQEQQQIMAMRRQQEQMDKMYAQMFRR